MNAKLVIDAGHGGKDGGATYGGKDGIREADYTLTLAQDMRHAIAASGLEVDVEMTRHQDTDTPHKQRGAVSKGFDADLVISLHLNANDSPQPKGLMVFYRPASKAPADPSKEDAEAKAIRERRQECAEVSKQVADAIMENAPDELERKSKDGIAATMKDWPRVATVLSYHQCPAVLVEVGFLSNPDDYAYLKSLADKDDYSEVIACLLSGVDRLLELLPPKGSTDAHPPPRP